MDLAFEPSPGADRQQESETQTQGGRRQTAREHPGDYRAGPGTEGHPYADLPPLSEHGSGDDAIETHDGEDLGQECQKAHQASDEPPPAG